MFDSQKQLFCYKLKKTGNGMVQEGISHRYTMMTLMGLHRLEQAGMASPFDKQRILQALLSDLSWVDNVGDLGVLLWMCGIVCPERYAQLESHLEWRTALRRYRGARQVVTMELAWFLTGLSYWGLTHPKGSRRLNLLLLAPTKSSIGNQGANAAFLDTCRRPRV